MNMVEPDAFDINCMRQEYNIEYDRLCKLVMDGLISAQEFCSHLQLLKAEYALVLNNTEEE